MARMADEMPIPGLSGRRVLVTGAAGFIGFHLSRRLLDAGAVVLGLDNLNDYYDVALKRARLERLVHPGFTFERAELADAAAVMELHAGFRPETVIHLAAQAGVRYSLDRPDLYVSSNVAGFLSVIEACRHHPVGHLIYASSSSVYGTNAKLPFSEHDGADHPVSLYGATKRSNELMAHAYAHLFGVPATGLRFFTVYGPWGRPDMAYYKFARAILEGTPIDIYNHGRLERDFTYIDDVVDAMLALIDKPPVPDPSAAGAPADPARSAAPHRLYNIGNHTPVALERFIALIEEAVGRPAIRRMLPMQPGDVPATFAEVSDLADAVGFAPGTPLETGIRRFVDWYMNHHGATRAVSANG